jgi:hypothetical protein
MGIHGVALCTSGWSFLSDTDTVIVVAMQDFLHANTTALVIRSYQNVIQQKDKAKASVSLT